MYICPKCGWRISDDAGFCGNCGVKIVFPAAPVYEAVPVCETEEKKSGIGFSVTALVCGILSLISVITTLSAPMNIFGIVAGAAGIVFGALGKKRNGSGMAKAGFILGIIGVALYAFMFVSLHGTRSYDIFM